MSWRRSLQALALAGGLGAVGYIAQRRGVQRWQPDDATIAASGLTLPDDVIEHDIEVSDGGHIHCVERGSGPALVLVHGVTLDVGVWAHQFRQLGVTHRVIALTQRGHGQSSAGDAGFSFDRLAADLCEVLEHLDVRDAIVVGHSMGGMVTLTLAVKHPERLARHAVGIALVATSAGPLLTGPAAIGALDSLVAVTGRGLRHSARQGRGILPYGDLATWVIRAEFGANPDPAAVELTRAITSKMSPAVMADLIPMLLSYDLHKELSTISLPAQVVVGTSDRLTSVRAARVMAKGIPDSTLHVYEGCGHMVMLERSAGLEELLESFSAEQAGHQEPGRRLLRRRTK